MNGYDFRGKTKEQQDIAKNFFGIGQQNKSSCLSKPMSLEEFDKLVDAKKTAFNVKKKGLAKLGIDENQVREINPVNFWGFDKKKSVSIRNNRGNCITETWLFFSETQIYIYSFTFDMISQNTSEKTEEYFYKDITNFSSYDESIEKNIYVAGSGCKQATFAKGIVEYAEFKVVVPGESFFTPVIANDETEKKVQAMKQKLREKKQ